jgi:sodium-dependent phosphate cotransporter
MFNWLTVLVLLPVEIASGKDNLFFFYFKKLKCIGMLYHLTDVITNSINLQRNPNSNPEFLTVITKPLTDLIVQVIFIRIKFTIE